MRPLARPVYNLGSVILVLGLAALHGRFMATERYNIVTDTRLIWWLVFLLVLLPTSYALGLPETCTSRASAALRSLAATAISLLAISAIQLVVVTPLLPRSSSGLVAAVLPIWTVVGLNLTRDATNRAASRDRVFLVADSKEDADTLADDLVAGSEQPATIVGFMPLAEVMAENPQPVFLRTAEAAASTIVVLDSSAQSEPFVVDQAAQLHRDGVRIRTLSLFYEEWIGKLPHPELARVSLLFDIGELHRVRYVRAKRVFDISFAIVGMVALAPVALGIAVLNPFLNKGSLFYRQDRVGKDGELFSILKFRTMAASKSQPTNWTSPDDVRITPLGGLLRRSHLDELPQAINIFRGDLSLIGPRPEQPRYVEELSQKIAFYDIRHIVRPGLTGWAQVKQGYASDEADAFEKLQFDMYYLRRQGVTLDLRIAWRTVRNVLSGGGR